MARLFVCYDPEEVIELKMMPRAEEHGIRRAALDIAADLADRDIYEIARKLAELLLEQL